MKNIEKKIIVLLLIVVSTLCSRSTLFAKESQLFRSEKISKAVELNMLTNNTHSPEAPVHVDRLRLLTITYLDFDKNEHQGQMIVLDTCADAVLAIFRELFEIGFPIAKMCLMDDYKGNDEEAMTDNNTSCYNYRMQTNSNVLSAHAYGVAIDINPIQNPYISFDEEKSIANYLPNKGILYGNRMLNRIGKEYRPGLAEEVVNIFAKHGFYTWGGYWDNPIDYQHFQISKPLRELFVAVGFTESVKIFTIFKKYFNKHNVPLEGILKEECKKQFGEDLDLIIFYEKNKQLFYKILNNFQ